MFNLIDATEWGLPQLAPPGVRTSYDATIAAGALSILIEGKPLSFAAEAVGTTVATLLRWAKAVPEFGTILEAARREGAHVLMDECLTIADGPDRAENKNVRINTRMKIAGILNPIYSPKIINEHTGKGGGPIAIATTSLKDMTDAERKAALEWFGVPPQAN